MLSCKDFVKQQNEQLDDKEFSFLQRISMKMHYFICVHCRRYTRQLFLVNKVSKKLTNAPVEASKIESCLEHIHHNQEPKEN